MKILKVIYKSICLTLIFGVMFFLRNTSITMESKAENINLNKNVNLNAMAKVIQNFRNADIYTVLDTYYGKLTGYVADCPLCSGYLACNNQNVLDRTTTYNDKVYGNVRIVASSTSLACGSIVRFTMPITNEEVTAIVLDRGVTGTSLDLLVESDEYAIKQVGNKKINYDILRYGWQRLEV